MIFKGEVNRA